MIEMIKGVLIGVLSTAVVAGFGYVMVVKVNQEKIANIESMLKEHNGKMSKSDATIGALKLFVVAAHPERDYMPIVSAEKLKAMHSDEIITLAAEISESNSRDSWVKESEDSSVINGMIIRYDLTEDDMKNIYDTAVNASYSTEE